MPVNSNEGELPMLLMSRSRAFASAAVLSLILTACAPKDADIKAEVDKAVAGMQGVSVDVTGGVATISGEVADEATKSAAAAAVKGVKGVKSVVDNSTVAPPPAPVVISADDSLTTNVSVVLKDAPLLTANVKDGVITLTGEVDKAVLPKIMQALSALHPKKIENKATVKK